MLSLKTYFVRLLTVLAVFCFIDIVCSMLFLEHVRHQALSEDAAPFDAGFIFFGGANPSVTQMNVESLRRTDFALKLFQAGKLSRVVCLGGAYPSHGYSGSEDMKKYLIQKGVPEDKIISEHNSYDSKSNWRAGCAILKQNHWQQVVLIASPLHVFRLKKMIPAHDCGATIHFAAYDYATQNPRITCWQLWKQVHYEWTAYLAEFLLPDSFYQNILKRMRQ
jgi:uncharacterized SAM-binding protein YcdF (DUF218 family)